MSEYTSNAPRGGRTTRTLTLGQLSHTRFSGTTKPFFHVFLFLLASPKLDRFSFFSRRVDCFDFLQFVGRALLTGRRRRSVDFYLLVFADLVFRSLQIVLIHSSAHGTQDAGPVFPRGRFFHTHTVTDCRNFSTVIALLRLSFSHSTILSRHKNTSPTLSLPLCVNPSVGSERYRGLFRCGQVRPGRCFIGRGPLLLLLLAGSVSREGPLSNGRSHPSLPRRTHTRARGPL